MVEFAAEFVVSSYHRHTLMTGYLYFRLDIYVDRNGEVRQVASFPSHSYSRTHAHTSATREVEQGFIQAIMT